MKKLLTVIAMAFLLAGCNVTPNTQYNIGAQRFEIEYIQDGFAYYIAILVDNETGQKYLLVKSGSGAGLTKMD